MSALGQKRTWSEFSLSWLLDDCVGTGEHCWRYYEAECFGGFKIDYQFVLCRHLHRDVGWFLALEDAVDIAGGASKSVLKISSIRNQTAGSGEQALRVDRGKSVLGRKLEDEIAVNVRQRTRRHNQAAITRTRERRDAPLDLAGVAEVERAYVHANRPRHGLDDGELADAGDCRGIAKDCRSRYTRRNLFEQFQPFCAQIVFET